jgi:uncharacterized membrane protein YcfT
MMPTSLLPACKTGMAPIRCVVSNRAALWTLSCGPQLMSLCATLSRYMPMFMISSLSSPLVPSCVPPGWPLANNLAWSFFSASVPALLSRSAGA